MSGIFFFYDGFFVKMILAILFCSLSNNKESSKKLHQQTNHKGSSKKLHLQTNHKESSKKLHLQTNHKETSKKLHLQTNNVLVLTTTLHKVISFIFSYL